MPGKLTLTVDEESIHAARKVALDRNTSVNNLIRQFLESVVAEAGEQRASDDSDRGNFPRQAFRPREEKLDAG